MKTYKEWFEEKLPSPFKEWAIENIEEDVKEKTIDNEIDALYDAFVWEESPQGHFLWSNLARYLEDPQNNSLPEIPQNNEEDN